MSEDIFEDNDNYHRKQHHSRELQLLTIRELMKVENGRAMMWRFLQNCCTFEDMFHVDPIKHAYNAGSRHHGLWLESELKEAAPEEYIIMLKEHIDE